MGKYTLVVTDTGNDVGTLTGQTLSLGVLSGSGPKGDGFTGGSFDSVARTFTFTSNDGLGFTTDPIEFDVVEDTTPQLGGDLDLNSSDITGTGNINITGSVTASGTVTSNDLVVNGNLTVSGTTTTVNTETVNIADNVILVNSNYAGSTPTEDGGIEVERGTLSNKSLVWDETNDKWSVGSETFVAGSFEGGLIGNVTGQVSDISNHSTSDLTEGTNLYYTDARWDTRLATKTTSDVAEGTNLYYTDARFDTRLAAKSTTDVAEGTNLYYTTARFDTAFGGKSTTDLTEGTNLYYTTARANTDIDTRVNKTYVDSLGVDASTLEGDSKQTILDTAQADALALSIALG